MGYWVYKIDPEPSMSIALLFGIPFIFVANLLLALLLFLFYAFVTKDKDNHYPAILALNSVISPIIFYLFFVYATDRNVAKIYKAYPFSADNKKYKLAFDLVKGNFSDNDRFNIYEVEDGGEIGILLGRYYVIKDTVFLVNDTSLHGILPKLAQQPFKMKMFDQRLTGFPLHDAEIKLQK